MEKNKLTQYLDEAEDEEGAKGIEAQIQKVDIKLKTMKDYTREPDQQTRKAPLALLTKETMLNQDWHDARYHRAIAAGVSHSEAWRKEKGRRELWKRRKSKDFRIGDQGSPHGDKARAKAMAEKETKGSCSRSVRPGVSQTFKGFTNILLSTLTRVQQFPHFPAKILKGTQAGNSTPPSIKRPQVNFLKITIK